jgi:putative ABC transport system permease protein
VSFDAGLAHGMGLKPGDTLSVNLLGRDITARIGNLREIDWVKLGINFAIVFAPGTLEAAPQTHLAAIYAPPAAADHLVRQITEQFPNVSAIDVGEALAALGRVVATVATGIRGVAFVTLVAGILVIGGAIAASHRRRVYDAVMLKVLGATRGAILTSFMLEYLLLGLLTAAIAAALGAIAAWAVIIGPLDSNWALLPGPLLGIAGGGVILTLALGLAGTWRALGAKPARFLRDD